MTVVRRRLCAAPIAVLGALVAAEAAVLALLPRSGVLHPVDVSVASVFTSRQIARGRDFSRGQLWLYAAELAVQAVVLVLLVVRARRRRAAPGRRPVLQAAIAGAMISLAVQGAIVPLHAIARERSIDVGLATDSWGAWAADLARSAAIGALLAAIGVALAVALIRRLPRAWWIAGAALVVAFGVAITFAGPLVVDPLFNRFTKLPAGPARTSVLTLARRAHVSVGGVYVVDASRRTTEANAYVNGVGSSRRLVLYDTLLRRFSPQETRLVVAHELGHVHFRDVPHGLLYLLLVAPLGMFAVARLVRAWGPAGDHAGSAVAPALFAAATLMALLITLVSNQLSRAVEARADSFALRLTGAAPAFVAQQRRIALQNLDDPQPSPVVSFLLDTHPPVLDRIGAGRAYERGAR